MGLIYHQGVSCRRSLSLLLSRIVAYALEDFGKDVGKDGVPPFRGSVIRYT
jgi:hypothetical protein